MQLNYLDKADVESFTLPALKTRGESKSFVDNWSHRKGGREKNLAVLPLSSCINFVGLLMLVHNSCFVLNSISQSGPGYPCFLPKISGWIKVAFDYGYQVLLLDGRGTGLSTPITVESLESFSDQEKADYLKNFRADSIVRDAEVIRSQLTMNRDPKHESRITLLGQSFGGFCLTTYLSLL